MRTRLTIPDGKLKSYLESFDGDVRFELIRLATNGLLNEGRVEQRSLEKTTGEHIDIPGEDTSISEDESKSGIQESIGVDFGDELFTIDESSSAVS